MRTRLRSRPPTTPRRNFSGRRWTSRGTRIRPSADIWAFGVLAHTVLTGTFPLPGSTTEARCDAATRYARGTEELRLSPELPDAWREIVRDCLAAAHAERPTAQELLRRVEDAAGAGRSPRLPRLRPRRRPTLVSALVAAALLSAATAAYALWDKPPATASAPPTCEKPAVYEDKRYGRGYTAARTAPGTSPSSAATAAARSVNSSVCCGTCTASPKSGKWTATSAP